MHFKFGTTRTVILIGKYALKFPRIHLRANNGWSLFLRGLLGNMNESNFGRDFKEELCPVVFRLWGGFLTVMLRAEELTEEEWNNFNFYDHFKVLYPDLCENKKSSFGKLNGRIVAVDYDGNLYRYTSIK
jgi:hypothetical protein